MPSQRSLPYRRLRGAGILAVSVLAHGLLLALPLSQADPVTEEPEPEIIDLLATPPMDVVTLPELDPGFPDQDAALDPAPAAPTASPPPPTQARPTPRATPPNQPAANPAAPQRTASPDSRPTPDTTANPAPESGATAADAPPPLEQRLLDAGEYVVDAGAKTGDPTDSNFFARSSDIDSWQASVAQDLIDETQRAFAVIRFDIPYQLRCERSLPTAPEPGLLAVIIDTSGNVVRGVDVVYSSKYPVLDQQAINKAVSDYVPGLEKPVSDTNTGENFQYRIHLMMFEVNTSREGC